jgi:hypothetical protein
MWVFVTFAVHKIRDMLPPLDNASRRYVLPRYGHLQNSKLVIPGKVGTHWSRRERPLAHCFCDEKAGSPPCRCAVLKARGHDSVWCVVAFYLVREAVASAGDDFVALGCDDVFNRFYLSQVARVEEGCAFAPSFSGRTVFAIPHVNAEASVRV